jgi:hypothetical protein
MKINLICAVALEVHTTTGLVSVFRFASLGLIIIGAQLHADAVYLGPAPTFALDTRQDHVWEGMSEEERVHACCH